jgi:heme-degrading monooxygenase HmoA
MNLIPITDQGVLAINVFTVRPGQQQALVDCIQGAGDHSEIPGLLSMHLLRSLDGSQVMNCMRWESEEAFRRATATNPVIEAARTKVMAIVDGVLPNRYETITVVP